MNIILDPNRETILKENLWWLSRRGYIVVKLGKKLTRLHRLIANAKHGQQVDHINRNKLDNRECNLRLCNGSQNMHNIDYKKGKSGLTGVTWHTQNQKWIARIRIGDGVRKHLGCFTDKDKAYQVYLKKKYEYLGN